MKSFWQFFSLLSHPLLVVTYGLILMILANSFLFGAASLKGHLPFLWIVLFSTFIIPALAVIMMKGLKMVSSFKMEDRRERVGPIFAACVLYSAFYFNVNRSNVMPEPFGIFILGVLISLFCCLFINSFYKVSLHAAGLAALVMGMFVFYFTGNADVISFSFGNNVITFHFILIPILLLIYTGLISSGRLSLKAHTLNEIMAGWMVGVVGQVIAPLI